MLLTALGTNQGRNVRGIESKISLEQLEPKV